MVGHGEVGGWWRGEREIRKYVGLRDTGGCFDYFTWEIEDEFQKMRQWPHVTTEAKLKWGRGRGGDRGSSKQDTWGCPKLSQRNREASLHSLLLVY